MRSSPTSSSWGSADPDFTARDRDLRTTVTITITGVNDAPSAEAGPAQTVAEGALVTLDGTGSDDEDAGDQAALGYQWAQVADPPTVTFTGADTDTATFSAPLVDADTQLTFTLTVTDPQTATDTDTVVVTVRADAEANLAGTLTEDTLNGATVTVTLENTEYAPETGLMPDDFTPDHHGRARARVDGERCQPRQRHRGHADAGV